MAVLHENATSWEQFSRRKVRNFARDKNDPCVLSALVKVSCSRQPYISSPIFRAALRKVVGGGKATHAPQGKLVPLLRAENVDKDQVCASKESF